MPHKLHFSDPPTLAADYMLRWRLTEDGPDIRTASSYLRPVLHDGASAMLKITDDPDEQRGNSLMALWAGHGAASVIKYDQNAILLERAVTGESLVNIVYAGNDDIATRHICCVAAVLHSQHVIPDIKMRTLEDWFSDLLTLPLQSEDWLISCARQADSLLRQQNENVILHGDLHHGNIVNFGIEDWRAIDPKGLFGERTAEYATLFLNPDLADEHRPYATLQKNFERRLRVVSACAGVEPVRLLKWIHAWSGLSAVWFIEEGLEPKTQRHIAELAANALNL
ncbi:APH(6) family putative aminoglycoside O-phosphotransferase [Wolbachia endosymbiont of Drosophila nikananu]|uniref:aminoglycoside phosphotransferase family protein n=1 Tax=Wolbachia endosymbiont of Drosophila nikananu TaxID=375550 RepID=UPI0023A9DFC9|nr:aminoglycoside phosphotransferase family protein [Wolbachia endosymbiont of Drosophila nikananu]MDE5060731.1 APH(6) family putative aminoglycoside O-phosphotransferase [Wolbachia endosymbiont of Drosophila nikananu]